MNDVNHWDVGAVLLLGAAALGLDEPPLVDAELDGGDHVVWPP